MPGNILLLQGPMGPFFRRLANDLEAQGATVYKINLNAGDWLFYRGANTVSFTGDQAQWPEFLAERIAQWNIDHIYLFGDTRAYHCIAREVARRLSVPVGVFEEGYLRPYYITLEEGGVNGRSTLPSDPAFYRAVHAPDEPAPRPVSRNYCNAAWFATWYYIAGWLGRNRFPHYMHHRPFNPYHEAYLWCRGALRKYKYQWQQRRILDELRTRYSGKFYLVPLQVHCDGQIRTCDHVASAAAFVRRVVGSFARHAPADTCLVLKHHPLDRGYSDYTRLVQKLTKRYGVEDRVYYVHDLHLPTLLDHAIGTVVINSTAGLSSLLHDTPVKTLGHAVYSMPGLSFQGTLDEFWNDPGHIDRRLNRRFRAYLAATSQLNGSFYSRPTGARNATGLDLRRLLGATAESMHQQAPVAEDQPAFLDVNWLPAPRDLPRTSAAAVLVPEASYDGGRRVAMAARDSTIA